MKTSIEIIKDMNDEIEHEAEQKKRGIIGEIVKKQADILEMQRQLADLRKKLGLIAPQYISAVLVLES